MPDDGFVVKPYISCDELVDKIAKYHADDDMDLVRRAYDFAEKAHSHQIRKSGDPYFCHPVAVAVILTDLMQDATTIAAALLHDVVEDVEGVTSDMIREQFGQEVEVMVDGVTKLNRLDFSSREEAQAETLRKMILAMAKDIRVVLIKLADRLHNMRTLKFQKPERQKPIAQETLDIFAPLAHRLGVYAIKWELEDLSLRYLDPDAFYELVRLVGMKRNEREQLVADVTSELKAKLMEAGIRRCDIDGRPKHFYSIYKKMKSKNKSFDEIYDLIAVRVLVNDITECYQALGVVHNTWLQMPGRFKDYISVPKANMYQSLHTTVVKDGQPFEVQIRTFEMHRVAEYGIAAHWRYKEGKAADALDDKLQWLRRILDWQNDAKDAKEFGEMLKFDLFADEVLVFTPRGDVVTLPKDATPLDFAYRIHTEVGNRCIGAKVNHHIVQLTQPLETGDFVEIMTAKSAHPSRDWLNIVKTSEAKTKIRNWLKREERDDNILSGRDQLEKEAKRLGYSWPQLARPEYLEPMYSRYSAASLDDLYAMIGFGGLSTQQVLNRLVEEYKKDHKDEEIVPPPETPAEPPRHPHRPSSSSNGVIVMGESGMLVRFARCCNPLPGDKIIGYITRGRGVSVHRADCVSLKDASFEQERCIEVEWEGADTGATYSAELVIVTYNRTGVLADISVAIAAAGIPVEAIGGHMGKNGMYVIHVTLTISGPQQLEKITRDLRKIPDVTEVNRGTGS